MILRLFRALMPREDSFVLAFGAHAAKAVEAAEAFRLLLAEPERAEEHQATVRRIEHEADEIAREVVRTVHRSFITPFDRSEILDLIGALDDVVDLMKDAGRRILLYRAPAPPQALSMADCVVAASRRLADGMPLLANVQRNAEGLRAMCLSVDETESLADRHLAEGLRLLFADASLSPGAKLMGERVYDLVEAVIDRCEDVAKLVEGIVAEQV